MNSDLKRPSLPDDVCCCGYRRDLHGPLATRPSVVCGYFHLSEGLTDVRKIGKIVHVDGNARTRAYDATRDVDDPAFDDY